MDPTVVFSMTFIILCQVRALSGWDHQNVFSGVLSDHPLLFSLFVDSNSVWQKLVLENIGLVAQVIQQVRVLSYILVIIIYHAT